MNKQDILEALKRREIDVAEAKRRLASLAVDATPPPADPYALLDLTVRWHRVDPPASDRALPAQWLANTAIPDALVDAVPVLDTPGDARWREALSGPADRPLLLLLEADSAQRCQDVLLRVFDVLRELDRQPGRRVLLACHGPWHAVLSQGAAGLVQVARAERPACAVTVLHREDADVREAVAALRAVSSSDVRAHAELTIRREGWFAPSLGACDDALSPVVAAPSQAPMLRHGGVYLVTGGAGGIGLMLARHLADAGAARVVLVGRRAEAQVRPTIAGDARLDYHCVDVTVASGVDALVSDILQVHGRLDGVIHAAGVLDDGFMLRLDRSRVARVLAPKLLGADVLDRATRRCDLDFFLACGSMATRLPNVGQAAYAAANRAMAAIVDRRAAQSAPGRSLCLHWPLWDGGSMTVSATALAEQAAVFGIRPMPAQVGLASLAAMLRGTATQRWYLYGERQKLSRLVSGEPAPRTPAANGDAASTLDVDAILALLSDAIADVTLTPKHKILPDQTLDVYGLDSLMIHQLNTRLATRFRDVARTVFFEYATLRDLAAHLATKAAVDGDAVSGDPVDGDAVNGDALGAAEAGGGRQSAPSPRVDESRGRSATGSPGVAIIGHAGRYPGADSVDALAELLDAGRDCIGGIPRRRWPLVGFTGGDAGSHAITAGGYLDDVEMFDPLFFGISPRDAENMDPQERLFLQVAWHALEDAGCTPGRLRQRATRADALGQPRHRIGVYVGIAAGQYALLVARHHAGSAPVCAQSSSWSVANRLSYFLDAHGPSLTVDTACSSSLSALEMACGALERGEIDYAIVGGASLNLDPLRNRVLDGAHMLSSDRRCRSFGAGGDGFVPGEGVVAVLLRRAADARRDGDRIQGVIRACGLNHGGRTHGYTVPSPTAQASLIGETLRAAGLAPQDIGYVEAHGTGTQLGDPIELNGLARAYGSAAPDTSRRIALGSIKSNIGHLEPAAALAGLSKILLQFRHRRIYPTLHADAVNPALELEGSRFAIATRGMAWTVPDGTPRRAALSSFGAGGANGHLVVEAAPDAPATAVGTDPGAACGQGDELFVFSAVMRASLDALVSDYLSWLRTDAAARMSPARLAARLRAERTPFDCRLAVIADSREALVECLEAFLSGRDDPRVACRNLSEALAAPGAGVPRETLARLLEARDWQALRAHWLEAMDVPFHAIAHAAIEGEPPLPLYRFERKFCWFHDARARDADAAAYPFRCAAAAAADGAGEVVFDLDVSHPLLADHRVNGRAIVAGTLQLELARAAAVMLAGTAPDAPVRFSDVVLGNVIVVEQEARLALRIARDRGGLSFSVCVGDDVHTRGRIDFDAASGGDGAPAMPDLADTMPRTIEGELLYDLFERAGYAYGPVYRGLSEIGFDDRRCVATLRAGSPDAVPAMDAMRFHPGIVDAGLQSIAALNADPDRQYLPYACAEIVLHQPAAAIARTLAVRTPGGHADEQCYDLWMFDAQGRPCVVYRDFRCRAVKHAPAAASDGSNLYRPLWRAVPAPDAVVADDDAHAPWLLVLGAQVDAPLPMAIRDAVAGLAPVHADAATDDFETLQHAFAASGRGAIRVLYCAGPAAPGGEGAFDAGPLHRLRAFSTWLMSLRGVRIELAVVIANAFDVRGESLRDPIGSALAGFSKSLAREWPRAVVRCLDFDAAAMQPLSAQARAQWVAGWLSRPLPCLPDTAVAIRADGIHVESFEPLPRDAFAHDCPLRIGGTYLILGGAGGLGMVTATMLAERYAATVVLVGRHLAGHTVDASPVSGGRILKYRADIASRRDMEALAGALRRDFGMIDGAFHSALVLRDSTVAQMSDEALDAVLAPKTVGVIHLFEHIAPLCRDLVVLYSSAISQNGTEGQANYAAASMFEDAYAARMSAGRAGRSDAPRVLVINWGFWRETGIVASSRYRDAFAKKGVNGLSNAEGMALLQLALRGREAQVVTGSNDVLTGSVGTEAAIDRQAFAGELSRFWAALDVHNLDLGMGEGIREVLQACVVDALALAFEDAGWLAREDAPLTIAQLGERIGVVPQYMPLLHATVAILVEAGRVDRHGDACVRSARPRASRAEVDARIADLVRRHADTGPILTLFGACMARLIDVMAGRIGYAEVMFPKGSDRLVAPLYRDNPASDLFNRVIREALDRRLASGADGTLRVLEIGAGTGGTTRWLIDPLSTTPRRVAYAFTDISSSFVNAARERYGSQCPWMRFAVLDIENEDDVAACSERFDVVVATNVLHATRDIRRVMRHVRGLMREDGLLLVNEACERKDIMTLTFGLSSGWWMARDPELRIAHSPLLLPAQWRDVLLDSGFADVHFIGDTPDADDFGHFACAAWTGASSTAASSASGRSRPATLAAPAASVGDAVEAVQGAPGPQADPGIHDAVRRALAELQKIPLDELVDHVTFDRYGLDSIVALQLLDRLQALEPALSNDDIQQHNTIASLSRRIAALRHGAAQVPAPPLAHEVVAAGAPAAAPVATSFSAAFAASRPAPGSRAEEADRDMHRDIDRDIAIVGMAGRYPGAGDLAAFWTNLAEGTGSIGDTPVARWPGSGPLPGGMGKGAYLDGIDRFDALFFHVSPRDAQRMDPQERLLLEACWHAIEDAGHTPASLASSAGDADVGVFAATMYGHYELLAAEEWAHGRPAAASSAHYALANNVSRLFGFGGPSLTVDSACASVLSALNIAVAQLRNGDCGAAVIAGVNLVLHPSHLAALEAMKMLSPRGRCSVFGTDADGFAVGEGVGAMVLRPLRAALAAGDHVHAVVKGSACNANGATATAAPNTGAQAAVIRRALADARLAPEAIDYVELQSTGSRLGDKSEFDAMREVFAGRGASSPAPLRVGSLKPNIGHLEAAAGMAQLAKAVLQLRHGEWAPTLAHDAVRADLDFDAAGIALVRGREPWPLVPGRKRRAGVSSFGAGGGNAHAVIEEAPEQPVRSDAPHLPLLPLSARKPALLRELARRIAAHLDASPTLSLAQACFTLQAGRVAQRHRLCLDASDRDALVARLHEFALTGACADAVLDEAREHPAGSAPACRLDASPEQRRLIAAWWASGGDVDWQSMHGDASPGRVPLPLYPFEDVRHWFAIGGPPRDDLSAGIPPAVAKPDSDAPADDRSGVIIPIQTHMESVAARGAAGMTMEDRVARLADIEALVVATVSDVLKVPAEEIRLDAPLSEFGFDSITLTELVNRFVEGHGIDMDVTVFFEYTSLQAFAGFLHAQHGDRFVAGASASPMQAPEPMHAPEPMRMSPAGAPVACRLTEDDILRIARMGQVPAMPAAAPVAAPMPAQNAGTPAPAGRDAIEALVVREVCDVLRLDPSDVHLDAPLSEYGFDSITLTELVNRFSVPYGIDIDVTIFFEHPSLQSFAAYLSEHHADRFHGAASPARPAADAVAPAASAASLGIPAAIGLADVEALVVAQVCDVLRLDPSDVHLDAPLSEYGFDSITLTELVNRFSVPYGIDIDVTIFFEHPSLQSFAAYLFDAHGDRIAQSVAARPVIAGAGHPPSAPTPGPSVVDPPVAAQPAPAQHRAECGSTRPAPARRAGPMPMLTLQAVRDDVVAQVCDVLRLDPSDVHLDAPLSEFGFDSITLTELLARFTGRFGLDIDVTVFFEYSSLESFSAYLFEHHAIALYALATEADARVAARPAPAVAVTPAVRGPEAPPRAMPSQAVASSPDAAAVPAREKDVAIIGMAGQFPGSADLEAFWDGLCEGRTAITGFPGRRTEDLSLYAYRQACPEFERFFRGGFLDDFDKFDPLFFRISPVEARSIDPQQRLLLECAWHALENAGYNPKALAGSLTGVFVGVAVSEYADILRLVSKDNEARDFTGTLYTAHANRISFVLDLQGPSEAIDTACSSSLVAAHRAVQSIRGGECDLALAGGVNVILGCAAFLMFGASGMLANDGRCKSFDDAADGYVRGEGVGFVVLKSLAKAIADGDNIRAVIKGSAIRHGGHAASMTSPGIPSQVLLIEQALADAGVSPSQVGYIEAHGTGTRIGDPIEFNALRRVFAGNEGGPCAVGTVKANVGHLETAAGIAGLIKTVMVLERGEIPPLATLETVNAMIKLDDTRLHLPTRRIAWPAPARPEAIRTAGVSSFGIGGVIVHQVLQDGAAYRSPDAVAHARDVPCPVMLSAQSPAQLRRYAAALLDTLLRTPGIDLHDMALTLALGREAHRERFAIVASDAARLIEQLRAFLDGRPVADGWTGTASRTPAALPAEARPDAREAARAWVAGASLDWNRRLADLRYRKLALPGYPFERESHWVPGRIVLVMENGQPAAPAPARQPAIAAPVMEPAVEQVVEQVVEQTAVADENVVVDLPAVTRRILDDLLHVFSDTMHVPIEKLDPHSQFADFGVDSLSGLRIMQRLRKTYGERLPAAAVLQNPTLLSLAQVIAEAVADDDGSAPVAGRAAFAASGPETPVAPTAPVAAPVAAPAGAFTLVELKGGADARPLVVLCGISGDLTWSMHWLSALAGDQRVLGIEHAAFASRGAAPAALSLPRDAETIAREIAAMLRAIPCEDGLRLFAAGPMAELASWLCASSGVSNRLHEVVLLAPASAWDRPDAAQLLQTCAQVWSGASFDRTALDGMALHDTADPEGLATRMTQALFAKTKPPMPEAVVRRWLTLGLDLQQRLSTALAATPAGDSAYAGAMTVIADADPAFAACAARWPLASITQRRLEAGADGVYRRAIAHGPGSVAEAPAPGASIAGRRLLPEHVGVNVAGTRENIVCFPTLYGDSGYATTLSMRLGPEYAVHALEQWCGAHPLAYPTIEASAAAFVERLLDAPVNRPYTLLGLSFGGVIAYEVCRQLQNAGHDVARLILLDPYMPNTDAFSVFGEMRLEVDGKDLNQIGLAGIIFDRWRVDRPLDYDRLNHLPEDAQIDVMARHLASHSSAGLSLTAARRVIESHFLVDRSNRRANGLYKPAPLTADVDTLMVTASRGFYDPSLHRGARNAHHYDSDESQAVGRTSDPTKGFRPFLRGDLRLLELPTDHLSMPVHLQACARAIVDFLAERPSAGGDRRVREEGRVIHEI